MLINPFTPSDIASSADDFFGREKELLLLARAFDSGSVAIEGAIGIGKSSLVAQLRSSMEGFDSSHNSETIIAVGDKSVKNIDDAAKLLLNEFIEVDEVNKKIGINFGSFIGIGTSQTYKYFQEGKHLSVLKRIIEKETLQNILLDKDFLILCIDEADKCPVPIAQLMRSLLTHAQHRDIKQVKFLLSGISPYLANMSAEDEGVTRFIYKKMKLAPLDDQECESLFETKLEIVKEDAQKQGIELEVDEETINYLIKLSGGHPHLIQLLGAKLIDNENDEPDGVIDNRNLIGCLYSICYEDRGDVYSSIFHLLENKGYRNILESLIIASEDSFPTSIDQEKAKTVADGDQLQWMIDHDILTYDNRGLYGLTDEFLRVRIQIDSFNEAEINAIEQRMLGSKTPKMVSYDDEIFYDKDL